MFVLAPSHGVVVLAKFAFYSPVDASSSLYSYEYGPKSWGMPPIKNQEY